MNSKIERRKIGELDVDAGLMWLGDPYYVLHKDGDDKPETIGRSWSEFCDILDEPAGVNARGFQAFGHGGQSATGMGLVVSTGYGEGTYPVYATFEDGRVRSVTVRFF